MIYKNRIGWLVMVLLVIGMGFFMRGLYLTADPAKDLTISGGVVGDPGQYSLGARNKILFDQWAIEGWQPFITAPLMHYLNYGIYKTFGISYLTHRLIPLLFSCLVLLIAVYMVWIWIHPMAALITALLMSFNYPLIMYAKIANREFPMLFFFCLAVYFFIKAVQKQQNLFFGLSALALFLSYMSKGTALYLFPVFLLVGLAWLLEKKMSWTQLLVFGLTIGSLLGCWFLFWYLPNKDFFNSFIGNNQAVRHVSGFWHLINNMIKSPFLFNLRSDPILLIVAFMVMGLVIFKKLTKNNRIPYLIEFSCYWLVYGTLFNAVVSYRPTRFFLNLIIPACVLCGYGLYAILSDYLCFRLNWQGMASVSVLMIFIILAGIIPFYSYVWGLPLFEQLLYFFPALSVPLMLVLSKQPGKIVLVTLILAISLFYNGNHYFLKWLKSREYQLINISGILNQVIPPANIVGNWASMLATGTKHKTFYTWKGMFNEDASFMKREKIGYALITLDRSSNEMNHLPDILLEKIHQASLMAVFNVYHSQMFFYNLEQSKNHLIQEFESFQHSQAQVVYCEQCQGKMALEFTQSANASKSVNCINKDFVLQPGDYQMNVSARGRFQLKVEINGNDQIFSQTLFVNHPDEFKIRKLNSVRVSLKKPMMVSVQIQNIKTDSALDYIEFIPDHNNEKSPDISLDNTGTTQDRFER